MAKILDASKKVRLGYFIPVENQNKKFNESSRYLSLQVEDEDGSEDSERCLLFTDVEISDMEKVEIPFSENMKLGRIYKAKLDNKETYLLKAVTITDFERVLRLSKSQLKTAEERAKRNPEDLTKKGLFEDLLD